MDVGTASAVTSYSYQTALKTGTQGQAVLQALARTYANASAAGGGDDALAGAAGAQNLGPLVSAIYGQTQATDPKAAEAALKDLGTPSYGGLDSGSATSLLASLGSGDGDSDAFSAAMGSNATLALTAYQAQQTYGAQAPAPGTTLPQILQAAQTATTGATFTLLS